jgi:hypothetical protein
MRDRRHAANARGHPAAETGNLTRDQHKRITKKADGILKKD